LFGVPLNFANMIILPIIFGIGVNAGVHMVHRWRAEPFGRPAGLSGATGRGITLTMVTTMIGFGCLLLAQHRGIRSLGFVMVIGLGVTLLACYTVLPAVLRWRTRAVAQAVAEPRGQTLRAARLGTNRHWQQTSTSWRKSA
ncbi:MAG: MMPL family transporter, partial [Phycisphaerales bacterium]